MFSKAANDTWRIRPKQARLESVLNPPPTDWSGVFLFGMSSREPFDWEWRVSQWSCRDLKQNVRIVVGRNAIGTQSSARFATVDNRPFAPFSHPKRDRLHCGTAVGTSITGNIVQVQRMEAVGAVIAMVRTSAFGMNHNRAVPASKRLVELT